MKLELELEFIAVFHQILFFLEKADFRLFKNFSAYMVVLLIASAGMSILFPFTSCKKIYTIQDSVGRMFLDFTIPDIYAEIMQH